MTLQIPPEGYLLTNTMNYKCLVAIANGGSSSSPYVLGDSFIRNFYTTFDYKKKTISFAKSSNAPAGVSVGRDFTTWAIVGISAACVVGVSIIYAITKKCLRLCKKNPTTTAYGSKSGVTIGRSKGDVAEAETKNFLDYNSLKGDEIVYSAEN